MTKGKPMEFVRCCIADNSRFFVNQRKRAGLSSQLAERFLPAMLSCMLPANEDLQMSQAVEDLISDNPAQVLHYVDTALMARQMKITPELVKYGLNIIEPLLTEVMAQKKSDIVDVVIALAWEPDGRISEIGI